MASIKISQLPVGGSINSSDELPVSRGGLETYRIRANQIVTTGSNIGGAAGVYRDSDTTIGSTTLNFRSLSAVGEGIQVIQTANTVNISISGQNPIKTVFTGTGSQVNFPFSLTNTSSRNINNYRVDIDGVLQEPGQTADYYLNGSNLTFTTAPPLSSKIVVISNNLLPLVEPRSITATDTLYARTLEDRFRDIINVKDFGAIGDGVTDDTAAIQAALNASNNVEPVLIPKGNYVLTSTLTAFCPVIFNGVISVSSLSSVSFKLKSQPIVFNDYRKIYMGTEWTNPNSLLAGIALQRAVDELAESLRYHTLEGEGASIALGHSINVDSFPAVGLFGRFKTIQNLTVVLSAGFGIRNPTTQAVTTSAQAYAFDINAPTTPSTFGFSFNNVTIYGQKNGNGIYYGIQDNNQESSIVNCNFTNFYNKGIKSIHPLKISKCRLTGGEFNLRDADRITTGIELYAGDSEIIDTTVSYCKTGIYAEGSSLTLMDVHCFNGSTDNESPVLWVNNANADMRATGCYFDNGPIWIYPLSSVSDTFGRCTFDSSVFTWGSTSAGNRSWVVAKPVQSDAKLRGIITTGCQFRDYRVYQRRFTYTGNGLSAAYISPLAKTTTGGSYTEDDCGVASGSNLITVSSTNKYTPGLKVTGTGIPSNTVIDSIVDTMTLQLNNNATVTNPNTTLTFSETVEVKIGGTRTFNFTLGGIDYSDAQNPEQILTFTSAPTLGSNIVMVAKYFAINPFEVDTADGTIDNNDAWDIHVKNNSYFNNVTNSSDIEPVLRVFSSPIIKIETNGVDTSYDVDWDWIVPFRLHITQIESIGWRCKAGTYVPPPSAIGYDYDTARRGKVTLSSPISGYIMIKGHCAGFNDINVV